MPHIYMSQINLRGGPFFFSQLQVPLPMHPARAWREWLI